MQLAEHGQIHFGDTKTKETTINGIERIAAERQRQVERHKWTPEHDDSHSEGELALAAVCYATPELLYKKHDYANRVEFVDPWPESWDRCYDRRPYPDGGNVVSNDSVAKELRIRMLEKAGALIAAEIDRLLRT